VSCLAKDYSHFDKFTKLHGVTSRKAILIVTSVKAHIFTSVALDRVTVLPFRKYSVLPHVKCGLA